MSFLDADYVTSLPWSKCSSEFSTIVVQGMARNHRALIIVGELRQLVEAAWVAVLVHDIQNLFKAMMSRIQ